MITEDKVSSVTGVVTIAVAGLSASFTANDLHQWGNTALDLAPLMLILFLIWRIHCLDKQHRECGKNLDKLHSQVLFSYTELVKVSSTQLPSACEFKEGNFCAVPDNHDGE